MNVEHVSADGVVDGLGERNARLPFFVTIAVNTLESCIKLSK